MTQSQVKTYQSPSAKYTLEVESLPTKPGCWNYTRGTVKRGTTVIATVDRNYSSFPYLFIEDHPTGHDYLVCGENYQGQTVIDLNNGNRRNYLPEAAASGAGFCWGSYAWNKENKVLTVNGCYWAFPYEWKFFDFSDPIKGWPEIVVEDNDLDLPDSDKWPEWHANGTVTVSETRQSFEDEEGEESEVVATRILQREGLTLKTSISWVAESEQLRRYNREAARLKWEAEWDTYKATNPLFLRVKERTGVTDCGIGQCFEGWHPTSKYDDARICFSFRMGRDALWSASLEFGMRQAPIKVTIYQNSRYFDTERNEVATDPKENCSVWFPHSVEGIDEALNLILTYVKMGTE